ncbi:uncharacterized protein [Apostichopus japonicus]|uniref:uncharacterized protein isoform X2 n=1 Tax=Stichopus japonicus TaxID=307972 RepID=UPI003AB72BEB
MNIYRHRGEMAQYYSDISDISNSEENVPQCCEILNVNSSTPEEVARKVKELQEKLVIRNNAKKEYHVELHKLWKTVRRQESDHDDRDKSDDGIDEEKCEENLKKIHEEITDAVAEIRTAMDHIKKEYTVPFFCPLIEAQTHHLKYASSPLSFADIKIKLSHGASTMSFKEGSEYYLNTYFAKKTTYRIPVGYKKRRKEAKVRNEDLGKRQLSHIPDEDIPYNEPILSERKGFNAEENVASCIEKWGKQNGKRMMIFTNLRIPDRTIYYPRDIVSTDGEFDVLVLCDEFILFCQVKGVDERSGNSNKRSKLKEAWQQSDKDLLRFGEATRDLPFILNVPIHTAIAVPNLNSGNLEALGVCKYHRRFILCKCDMEPFSHFGAWISNIINPKDEETPKISEEDNQTLCARFVGLISKVPIPTERDMILDTHKNINPGTYVNKESKLFSIFTPDQRQLYLAETELVIIRGEFGTGKSLVLLAKALSLLEDGNKKPMIISLSNIASSGYCYHNAKCEFVDHLKRSVTLPTEQKDNWCSISAT